MRNFLERYLQAGFVVLSFVFLCGFSDLGDIERAIIEKDFHKAQALAQEFMRTQPEGEEKQQVNYYLGLSQLGLEQYAEGRQTFHSLLKSEPRGSLYDKASLGVIDSYSLEENYTAALREAEHLLKRRGDSELLSLIYLKVARAHLKLAHWEEARRYLRMILEKFPASFEVHIAKQLLSEEQYFAIQVGSFLSRQRANALVEELKQKGEYAYTVEVLSPDGQQFYRVRVGRFSSLDEAKSLRQHLTGQGYPTRIYP